MIEPLFIATERFDPSDGEKRRSYYIAGRVAAMTDV
jgi:hypothetical protein